MANREIGVSGFKAKHLDLLDQISRDGLDELTVTKRAKPVARVVARPAAPGVDLSEPVYDGPWDAELGIVHN